MDFVVMFPEGGILLVGPVRFTLVAVIIITAFSMLKEQFSQRKEIQKTKRVNFDLYFYGLFQKITPKRQCQDSIQYCLIKV